MVAVIILVVGVACGDLFTLWFIEIKRTAQFKVNINKILTYN